MSIEIERKYLVKGDFKKFAVKSYKIAQGFLSSVPERTVRIRVNEEKGFITVKGIKAQGNHLTTDKIKTVNMLESLPYEAPVVNDVEVNDEEIIDNYSKEDDDKKDDKGQITMF